MFASNLTSKFPGQKHFGMQASETQTMTLAAKAEKLRTHFGMNEALTVSAVITASIAELGLDARVEGFTLVQKTDACLAALMASRGESVMPLGVVVEESVMSADARVREAEMRAERAEAHYRGK